MFIKINTTYTDPYSTEEHYFQNFHDIDLSYYDDMFFSNIGYADFTVKFAFIPGLNNDIIDTDDDMVKFSKWWQSLDKNNMPQILVRIYKDHSKAIAWGIVHDWEENREDGEVTFACIDDVNITLNSLINKNRYHIQSDYMNGERTSYYNELQSFFSNAICEWWTYIHGYSTLNVPSPMQHSFLREIVEPIDNFLKEQDTDAFKARIVFNEIRDLSRKEILSEISKLTQSKILYSDGFLFSNATAPVTITGHIKSINSASTPKDIEPDKIISEIALIRYQLPTTENDEYGWLRLENFTNMVKIKRDEYLQKKCEPHPEYHIWGYRAENSDFGTIQVGQSIILDNETYTIREISYESETMHTINSFEAVCIKSTQ